MPGDYFRETVIMIDYDAKMIRIDTTKDSDANKCRKKGFTEITAKSSRPYRRFTGDLKLFRVNFGKKQVGRTGGNPNFLIDLKRKQRQESILVSKDVST